MRFIHEDYYMRPPRASLVPGAIFLRVPIPFFSGESLPVISLRPDQTWGVRQFDEAWATAPEHQRDEGLPVLLRAKARPVVVLRVGAALTDSAHERSVWVAPLYSDKGRPRRGPNIFPLPAWPRAGLDAPGFADFYQATMVPQRHFRRDNYACEWFRTARDLLIGAVVDWARADPRPGR